MMLMQLINRAQFKKIIIIFWTLWWLSALWTDGVGALSHMGLLQKSWAPDTNYPFLVESLKMYPMPEWGAALFFSGILLWSLLSTGCFCWASLGLMQSSTCWMRRADVAFIVSLTFWFAFLMGDQMVMKFDLEENHMVQAGLQLLTYMTLYLLPSEEPSL